MNEKPFVKHILMVGFGSIGQAVLPLVFEHFQLKPDQITIITSDTKGIEIAKKFNVNPIVVSLAVHNYRSMILEYLQEDSVLLNLAVDVSSLALIELCQEVGAYYLDTSIEPWAGGYVDTTLSVSSRSNYALREAALRLKAKYPKGKTALLTHGANPGLVSHFLKRAMLNIAKDINLAIQAPVTRQEWAELAQALEIKVIHIAEQDTQRSVKTREAGEFLNTWSVEGFMSEGAQPAELGWGSHEKHLPSDASHHSFGCKAAIYINKPGLETRVRSWAPNAGPYLGFLITHNEAISIADFFTVKEAEQVHYRPTVHYSYHPCAAAILSINEFLGKNMQRLASQSVLKDEISQGMDELGVLVMGHKKGAYWFGSQLDIEQARVQAPYNNATSLQVSVGVLSGLVWILNHPNEGIIEPEQMEHDEVLTVAESYLGKFVGAYTDWTPLKNRSKLFPENIDWKDPWQFVNFRL